MWNRTESACLPSDRQPKNFAMGIPRSLLCRGISTEAVALWKVRALSPVQMEDICEHLTSKRWSGGPEWPKLMHLFNDYLGETISCTYLQLGKEHLRIAEDMGQAGSSPGKGRLDGAGQAESREGESHSAPQQRVAGCGQEEISHGK